MERVSYPDLQKHLLLKNGNYLYKVPFREGWAVLKVYYGSRSQYQYVMKSIGNLLVCNQTSFMPKARRKTELDCIELWREHGFRVFDVYEDVVVDDQIEDGYAMYEYVEEIGQTRFYEYFESEDIPLEEQLATWRRFLPVWHRRHELAIRHKDPRLVHENGDMKHVVIMPDGEFLFFDFEMCFRSPSRIKEFVAREILAYLKSLGNRVGPERWDAFVKETVAHYPDRDLLDYTWVFAFKNPNPILRLARAIDRKINSRARKPFSKYNCAVHLHKELERTATA